MQSWVQALDHEEKKSLAMLLSFVLVKELSFTETKAAKLTVTGIDKNGKTILVGEFTPSKMWVNSWRANKNITRELVCCGQTKNSTKCHLSYVPANAAVKVKSNMTSMEVCKWMNKTLLPNSNLEPGFPCQISIETSRKWIHEMDFEVLTGRKGIFVDGHERPDVIESGKIFPTKMVK